MAKQLSSINRIVRLIPEKRSFDQLLGALYVDNNNRSPIGQAFDATWSTIALRRKPTALYELLLGSEDKSHPKDERPQAPPVRPTPRPKRGAFPTPKEELDKATPYVPGDVDELENGTDRPTRKDYE